MTKHYNSQVWFLVQDIAKSDGSWYKATSYVILSSVWFFILSLFADPIFTNLKDRFADNLDWEKNGLGVEKSYLIHPVC